MKEKELRSIPTLSIPPASLNINKDEEGNLKVLDIVRKKFVSLTPEEWVRQHFVNWLINFKGYPVSLISNEKEIKLNDTKKRFDTVVFGRTCEPLVIIEFKAPGIEISQSTFDQIVRYNMQLKAKYLIVSNGINHYCCVINYDTGNYSFIPRIPDYIEATGMPGIN